MGKVFISYSHKDEAWRQRLAVHLKVLEMEGLCSVWDDRKIEVGTDWEPEIIKALDEARVIVMLISADFLTSEFIRGVEVPRALERRQKEGIEIIPVLVRPCPWKSVEWLGKMQVFPPGAEPMSALSEHEIETAMTTLAEYIAGDTKKTVKVKTSSVADRVQVTLPVTGTALFGRAEQLELLDAAWADEHQHIVTFIAWGGVEPWLQED